MAQGRKVTAFIECEVLEQWKSKNKGTPCTKIGWNSKEGSGQQIFYGEDDLKDLPEGTIVTVQGSQDEKGFVRVSSVDVVSKARRSAAASA